MAPTKDHPHGRWTKYYNINKGRIEALKELVEMPPRALRNCH
jgi:hypothetical protein